MSLTDLTNNWFVYGAWSNGVAAMSSSKWFYSSRDGYVRLWKEIDLSNAKKLTMSVDYYIYYASWVGSAQWGIDTSSSAASQWAFSDWLIGWYWELNNNNNYKRKSFWTKWGDLQGGQYALSTGEHNMTMTIDFETWASVFDVPWAFTFSGTLTAEQIQTIKSTWKRFKASTCYNGNKQHQIWNAYRKIE